MIKNIIFDLDGVLIDSSGDIINCLEKAYQAVGFNNCEQIRKAIIGPPVAEMVQEITPQFSQSKKDDIVTRFRKYYDNNDYLNTKLYNSVDVLLKKFKKNNYNLLVATNKPKLPTIKILTNLNILYYFDDIATPNTIGDKKMCKTEMINYLIESNGLSKSSSVMIGDGVSDILAANKTNILAVAVLGGYGRRGELLACKPRYTIDYISDLYDLITSIS